MLMQQRVANELLGRISAIEGALYTISESASSVFGGAAFDVLHLSLPTLLAILTTMAGEHVEGLYRERQACGWKTALHQPMPS